VINPLTIRSGPEMGVAATKTFISQVAISFLLSLKTSTAMGKLKEGEEKNYLDKIFGLPKLISKVIMENEGKVTKVSGELAKAKSMYYLARWVDLPIAMEGALKAQGDSLYTRRSISSRGKQARTNSVS